MKTSQRKRFHVYKSSLKVASSSQIEIGAFNFVRITFDRTAVFLAPSVSKKLLLFQVYLDILVLTAFVKLALVSTTLVITSFYLEIFFLKTFFHTLYFLNCSKTIVVTTVVLANCSPF